MNIAIPFAAFLALVLAIAIIIAGPFAIGKPRPEFTAGTYLFKFTEAMILIILAGYVFGWWQ